MALSMFDGFIFSSLLVIFVAVRQSPMATPPIDFVLGFIINVNLITIAIPLIHWFNKPGDLIGFVAGLGVFLQAIVIVSGQYGSLSAVNQFYASFILKFQYLVSKRSP